MPEFSEFSCPHCKADLSYEANGKKYSRLQGWEVQGKYDGISYWHCPECAATWDRFTGVLKKAGEML